MSQGDLDGGRFHHVKLWLAYKRERAKQRGFGNSEGYVKVSQGSTKMFAMRHRVQANYSRWHGPPLRFVVEPFWDKPELAFMGYCVNGEYAIGR